MESAEDDAGAATNASRPVAAREARDDELAAATASRPRDTAAADGAASSDTPAMAEDNFDGDSVPSPSAHDVNTSTEAILDMIDEIVDGPGAPKRLPLLADTPVDEELGPAPATPQGASTNALQEESACASDSLSVLIPSSSTPSSHESVLHSSEPLSATSAKSENLSCASDPSLDIRTEPVLQGNVPANIVCERSVDSPQVGSFVAEIGEGTLPAATVNQDTLCVVESETLSEYSISNVATSSEETVQSVSHSGECQSSERTLQCAASSDQTDKVTVESAESTSSENSSSVENVSVQESVTRSPLRRRLVRPAPIDRRPDTTVSSTADSQSNVMHTSDRVASDGLTKDVSSSSDAVSSKQNRGPREQFHDNRDEVSICKAETSISPPKRIKLIRHKVVPQNSFDEVQQGSKDPIETQVCQSTSSDVPSVSLPNLVNQPSPSVNCISTNEAINQGSNLKPIEDSNRDEPLEQDSEERGQCQQNTETEKDLFESPQLLTNSDSTKDSQCVNEIGVDSEAKMSPKIDCNLPCSSESNETLHNVSSENTNKCVDVMGETAQEQSDIKVPKLTIKLCNKQLEEPKQFVPKLTIKPLKPPVESEGTSMVRDEVIPNVTKINIKPIVKPEKVNEIHRKSSSSDVSESESSENDDSASTSDHTSTSDQGPSDVVPKVTIRLGKPGTESEGQFYTEKNVPKLTIKGLHSENQETDESGSKIKLMVCQPEEKHCDKIPKLTIKPVTRNMEGQPLSPKLTIKPIKPPESGSEHIAEKADCQPIPKLKISQEMISPVSEAKECVHIPKITIKPITKTDDTPSKSAKKASVKTDGAEHIPVVTKLNIKPIIKPVQSNEISGEASDNSEEKVPVVSKINIKPIVKPKDINRDSRLDCNDEDIPKVTKINIKPLRDPENEALKAQECSEKNTENEDKNIPVVTKINIKPIIKPSDDGSKESRYSETGGSSYDTIPVVTKLNIKPIVKPNDIQNISLGEANTNVETVPIVTKLNIKPVLKPDETATPSSPKKEKGTEIKNMEIPIVTKLNIKPIVKPDDHSSPKHHKSRDKSEDISTKNPPLLMKINIKAMSDLSNTENILNSDDALIVNDLEHHTECNNFKDDRSAPGDIEEICKKITETCDVNAPTKSLDPEKCTSVPSNVAKNAIADNKIKTRLNCKSTGCADSGTVNNEDFKTQTASTPALLSQSSKSNKLDAMAKMNSIDTTHNQDNSFQEMSFKKDLNLDKSGKSKKNQFNIGAAISSETKTQADISQSIESPEIESDRLLGNRVTGEHLDKMEKTYEVNTEIPPLDRSEAQLQITAQNVIKDNKSSGKVEGNKVEQNFQLLKRLLERDKDKDDSLETRVVEPKGRANVNIVEKIVTHENSDMANRIKFVDGICDDNAVSEVLNTAACNADQPFIKEGQSKSDTKSDLLDSKTKGTGINLVESRPTESNSVLSSAMLPVLGKLKNQDKLIPESISKPLEITCDRTHIESSGQDSPRIILKINKTEQGASAKIITEDVNKIEIMSTSPTIDNTQNLVNETANQRRSIAATRKKKTNPEPTNLSMGKRLRSSKMIQDVEVSPIPKKTVGKRPSIDNTTPPKEPELSMLETKRLKLGQLLSNKALTITPLVKKPTQVATAANKQTVVKSPARNANHAILNNENCSKNGNSKLHNILTNLHTKHDIQVISLKEMNCTADKGKSTIQDIESTNTSTASSDIVEITPVQNSHPDVQEMLINENSNSQEFISEEISQDPLDIDASKVSVDISSSSLLPESPIAIPRGPMTPQPKRRGRPRKLPASEGRPVTLPVPALEERPQRSLRLTRDRPLPTILAKPRGRGRGRGVKRAVTGTPDSQPTSEPLVEAANKFFTKEENEDLTIKLPRLTETLEKMPSVCSTPLSSRSKETDMSLFSDGPELKVVLESTLPNLGELKSPDTPRGRGRGRGRGSRGGRPPKTPRGRGRRGGGRGAMYMKETMGIYGRVCGPATTTVQLFEEETCMMDDNATPAKPDLMDEDSQSSVKSSTNDSSRTKKSKFADLFDSNKVWTAADVKEYMWPPPETPGTHRQVMMIQEQVAMFLGVKSFKRRYPELKRRTIVADERDFVLSRDIVTEALCDLGITAVDASEVLDIMLSDYPHKYEEYRSHQRRRQISGPVEPPAPVPAVPVEPPAPPAQPTPEDKPEDKPEEKPEAKPEVKLPDPKAELQSEKNRQEMAAAAMVAASEYNTRLNAMRRPACVDLQSMTVHRRRAPPTSAPTPRVRPPAGFYPHALLPGQYQHWCRVYTPEQLRYFPLNTVLEAPPPPASPKPCESSSESDGGEWGSSSSSEDSSADNDRSTSSKRKKMSKVRAGSESRDGGAGSSGAGGGGGGGGNEVDLCRTCGLREEATRKYTHERFLVCSNCSAKLHPSCLALGPDTVRKCRGYAWQCAECKSCGACSRPADDDKMPFCDLCDRGFHIYCVGLAAVPSGRWTCAECSVCKSCGARSPAGPGGDAASAAGGGEPAEWHHHSKRGPGGQKVYSHSVCAPCARAYRIGRYCPMCDRSFIGPKGTMQLVICKLCDRQLHQECVRQTVPKLDVLDYTCGRCRRGGITSRAAAARVAPRTIATLFMAKRRFNKYAHRQYMESRMRAKDAPPNDDDND